MVHKFFTIPTPSRNTALARTYVHSKSLSFSKINNHVLHPPKAGPTRMASYLASNCATAGSADKGYSLLILSVSKIAKLFKIRFPSSTAPPHNPTRNDPKALANKEEAWTTHQQKLSSERNISYLAASTDPNPYCYHHRPLTEDVVQAHVTRMASYLAELDNTMKLSGG